MCVGIPTCLLDEGLLCFKGSGFVACPEQPHGNVVVDGATEEDDLLGN